MNLQGERRLPASPEQAWTALNDPQALKACITGCESLELTGPDEYSVVMAVRVGPVNARFKGRLRLLNIQPLQSYTIEFDGQGGVAGFGKGSADVALSADGDHTLLRYGAKAQVGGKIAQIGSRLVDSAAEKVAGEFFAAFEKYLTEQAAAAAPAAEAPAAAVEGAAPATEAAAAPSAAAPTSAPTQPAAGGLPWGWLALGAAVLAAAAWLLAR
ncbi:MAG: carbon monoxide dehydrogenase subunit G [Betaproteobacteria bacterium]|nr:carbon monoxide dehydrogenase subunit G [Betaproteobacteria bacterium]